MRVCVMLLLGAGNFAAACRGPASQSAATQATGKVSLSESHKARVRKFWEVERMAIAADKERRYADAVPLFEQAIRLDPDHQDSHYVLAGCLAELGRYDEAIRLLERLIEISPGGSPRAYGLLADLFARMEPGAPTDFARAVEFATRQKALNPEDSGPMFALGEAEMWRGDPAAAVRHLENALGLNHTSARGTYDLGLIALAAGDRPGAGARFARAVELGKPKDPHKGVRQEGDTREAPPPLTGTALVARAYADWSAAAAAEALEPIARSPSIQARMLASADFDLDGDLDLAVADEETGVRLYEWTGAGLGDVTVARGIDVRAGAAAIAWGDIDGDRRPDLWAAGGGSRASGEGTLWQNQGERFHAIEGGLGLAGSRATARAVFADLDRDGFLDLIECGGGAEPLRAFRSRGSRFEVWSAFPGPVPARPCTSVHVADTDRDGAPDVLATFWKLSPRLYRSDGSGNFHDATRSAGLAQAPIAGWASAVADLDGDGRPDILLAPWNPLEVTLGPPSAGAPLRLWHALPDGTFADASASLATLGPSGAMDIIVLSQVDGGGDRRPDLLVANGGARADARAPAWLLRNQGGLSFERTLLPAETRLPWNVIAAARIGRDRHVALIVGGLYPRSGRGLVVVALPAAEARLVRGAPGGASQAPAGAGNRDRL